MDSPSPTEGLVPDAAHPAARLRWWQLNPGPLLDEPSRKKQARAEVEGSSHVLIVCSVIVAVGSIFCPFSARQILFLCFCGVLATKFLLMALRSNGSRRVFFQFMNFAVIIPIVVMPEHMTGQSMLLSIGMWLYALACTCGVSSLLLWLFRESFLRYVEGT